MTIGFLLILSILISISVPLIIRYRNRIPSDGTIRITSDDDFYKYSFTGDGTKNNPFIIESRNIKNTENIGILIKDTTKHFIIRNNFLLSNYEYGINIENIADETATIQNNTILRQNIAAIKILNSHSVQIINNTINQYMHKYGDGINLEYCNNTLIRNNYIMGADDAIEITSSDNCTISDNIIEGTGGDGDDAPYRRGIIVYPGNYANISNNNISRIDGAIGIIDSSYSVLNYNIIDSCSVGICISGEENVIKFNKISNCTSSMNSVFFNRSYDRPNYILNNTIRFSKSEAIDIYASQSHIMMYNLFEENFRGITMYDGSYNSTIRFNEFRNSTSFAIGLSLYSSLHKVHHNNFLYNYVSSLSQCADGSYPNSNNTWYDESSLTGNYWSNWNGTGYYYIYGSANAIDFYPLLSPIFLEF